MLDRLANLSFGVRLIALVALTFLVLGVGLTFVARQTVERALYEQFQADVQHAGNFHRYLVDEKGVADIVNGKLQFGSWVANNDFSVVDRVKQVTGAEATLFQLIDGKLIRVSTTILRLDNGQRGVGTELIGPAAAAFARGEGYRGVGPILDRDFITRYDLIRDKAGAAVGYVLTAVPISSLSQTTNALIGQIGVSLLVGFALCLIALYFLLRPTTQAIEDVVSRVEQYEPVSNPIGYRPGDLLRAHRRRRDAA